MTIMQIAESFGLTEAGSLSGGSVAARRNLSPKRAQALKEAAELWAKAWNGNRLAGVVVNEALTTSDLFVSATGDLLDRELLTQFGAITPNWQEWASPSKVRNFKPKKLVDIMGGRSALDAVPELTEYPESGYTTKEYSIQAAKYGRRFGFSWEAGINDDIDELQQMPARFASAAALTENRAALDTLVTLSTGVPDTGIFKSYNTAAANPIGYSAFDNSSTNALTTANLITGLASLASRTDLAGNPVSVDGIVLLVGPALQFIAQRIVNATEYRTGSNPVVVETNPVAGAVRVVVSPDLVGNSWFLLPDPRRNNRPAVAVAHLAGFETPDLRVSSNTGSRVGGGAIAPEDGDFEIDGVWYRVRHVVGAASVDVALTYGSTGATGTAGV